MVVKVMLIAVLCITSTLSHPLGILDAVEAAGGLLNGGTAARAVADAVIAYKKYMPFGVVINPVIDFAKGLPGIGVHTYALTNLGKTDTDAVGAVAQGLPGSELGGNTDALSSLGKAATGAVGTVTQGLPGIGLGGQTEALANLEKTATEASSGLGGSLDGHNEENSSTVT